MATYKSDAGAILEPGNQINVYHLSTMKVLKDGTGVEAFEQIGFVKVNNASADKASFKSFDITVPSPDRRVDDRVRDDRTSLVVKASSDRPAYVYGASIALAQDILQVVFLLSQHLQSQQILVVLTQKFFYLVLITVVHLLVFHQLSKMV